MKDFFIKKQAIDKKILTNINNEIVNEFDHFLSQNENIGGLNSGNLNATIGAHADTLHRALVNSGIFKEIEEFFDISLKDYFLTVDSNFDISKVVRPRDHKLLKKITIFNKSDYLKNVT